MEGDRFGCCSEVHVFAGGLAAEGTQVLDPAHNDDAVAETGQLTAQRLPAHVVAFARVAAQGTQQGRLLGVCVLGFGAGSGHGRLRSLTATARSMLYRSARTQCREYGKTRISAQSYIRVNGGSHRFLSLTALPLCAPNRSDPYERARPRQARSVRRGSEPGRFRTTPRPLALSGRGGFVS